MPLPLELERRSLDELKTIKEDIEGEIKKAEKMNSLVKTMANIKGFPYAMFEVFRALQDGVTVLGEDLRVLWRNEVAAQQLGLPDLNDPSSENGYCYHAHGRDKPCTPCACIEAMDSRKTQIKHDYHGPKEGVSYDLWAIPLYNGHRACILITRDTTRDDTSA